MEADLIELDRQIREQIPVALEGQDLVSKIAWASIDYLLDCRQALLKMGAVPLSVEVEFYQ